MKKEKEIVEIKLSLRQAEILKRAIDLFVRIGMGQIEEVAEVAKFYNINGLLNLKDFYDVERTINYHLGEAKKHLGIRPFSNLGITNAGEDFRIAYDIEQVLRRSLAFHKNPKGDHLSIEFDDYLPTASEKKCSVVVSNENGEEKNV